MLQRNAKTKYSNDDRLDLLMKKADLGDWFLLFLLSKNLDSILFREFISQLTEKLKTEPQDDLIWDTDPSQVLLQVNSIFKFFLVLLKYVIWSNFTNKILVRLTCLKLSKLSQYIIPYNLLCPWGHSFLKLKRKWKIFY